MSCYIFNRCFVLFGAVAICCAVSGLARGELLFSDNYNTTTASTDMNEGIGTIGNGRTAGLYETATYVQQGDAALGTGDYVALPNTSGSYGWAWIDHDFIGTDSAGGMEITMRMNVNTGTSYSHWSGIGIGGPAAMTGQTSGVDNDPRKQALLIAFRGGDYGESTYSPCLMLILDQGANMTPIPGSSPVWSLNADGNDFHDFRYVVTGVGDDDPFDGVGLLNVKVYVDGGTTAVLDYTSPNVYSNNYIGLEDDRHGSHVDNLTISNIPEPSTLALLATGLIGLLAYAWRKRK